MPVVVVGPDGSIRPETPMLGHREALADAALYRAKQAGGSRVVVVA